MLQVVDVPDGNGSDGLLLPVPGTEKNSIVLEPRDGNQITTVPSNGVALHHRGREVVRIADVDALIWVTDARIAFACSRYDKGGRWRGDPISMGVFNAVSKVRAVARSHGKSLVGQARYPWIARVGSTARAGIGSEERLIIDASESENDPYRLVIGLPNRGSGAELAALIVRRAGAFRLATEADLDEGERRGLQACSSAVPLLTNPSRGKDHIYVHEMPSCWYISEKSARFTRPTV